MKRSAHPYKIAKIELSKLVQCSYYIARARIERTERVPLPFSVDGKPESYEIAVANVVEPLKNTCKRQRLVFSIESSGICDSSGAEPGETALLFLESYDGIVSRSGGSLPPFYHYTIPPALRRGVWQLAHAGRGRMPLENGTVTPEELSDLSDYFPVPKNAEDESEYPVPLRAFEQTIRNLVLYQSFR
jgi:hypothetical protein